ncbi:MAG: hypothetical protein H7839_13085 [Magnetococcus sp. YQC-5]
MPNNRIPIKNAGALNRSKGIPVIPNRSNPAKRLPMLAEEPEAAPAYMRPGSDTYDIRQKLPKFESREAMNEEKNLRYSLLLKNKVKGADAVATRLSECVPRPCMSPACPECARLFRRWKFWAISKLFRGEETYSVTIVPTTARMGDDDLMKFNPRSFAERIRHQLDEVNVDVIAVGGIEIDYHSHVRLWQPHIHLLVSGATKEELLGLTRFYRTKRELDNSDGVRKVPVMIKKIDNRAKAFSYILKMRPMRRDHFIGKDGSYRRPRKYRLDEPQLSLSLVMLNKFKLTDFLFLYNVSRRGSILKSNFY